MRPRVESRALAKAPLAACHAAHAPCRPDSDWSAHQLAAEGGDTRCGEGTTGRLPCASEAYSSTRSSSDLVGPMWEADAASACRHALREFCPWAARTVVTLLELPLASGRVGCRRFQQDHHLGAPPRQCSTPCPECLGQNVFDGIPPPHPPSVNRDRRRA